MFGPVTVAAMNGLCHGRNDGDVTAPPMALGRRGATRCKATPTFPRGGVRHSPPRFAGAVFFLGLLYHCPIALRQPTGLTMTPRRGDNRRRRPVHTERPAPIAFLAPSRPLPCRGFQLRHLLQPQQLHVHCLPDGPPVPPQRRPWPCRPYAQRPCHYPLRPGPWWWQAQGQRQRRSIHVAYCPPPVQARPKRRSHNKVASRS